MIEALPHLLLAALVAAQPALPVIDTEPTEGPCDYVTRDGQAAVLPEPWRQMLRRTAGEGPFAPPIPPDAAIRCERSDIVPAANDWKVLAAGHPFYIIHGAGDDQRLAVLELSDGRVHFRSLRGDFTEAEETRIQARLNAYQSEFQR